MRTTLLIVVTHRAGAVILAFLAAAEIGGWSLGLAGEQAQRGTLEWRIEQLAGVTVEDVRSLLTLLKERVTSGDRQGVCALVAYPLWTPTGEIPNSARCVREYANLFNGEVVAAIRKQRFEDLFANWEGVGIGDDDVWLAGVCRGADCVQFDLRITRLSSMAVLDHTVLLHDVLSGPLSPPRWVTRPGRPSPDELQCLGSSLFWSTSVKGGVLHATRTDERRNTDPLPFKVAAGRDRAGARWVRSVPDGWLVGFDQGEFGGGLWWFNREGTESRRIRPDRTAPAHPEDIFRAENVIGLPVVGGDQLVLMGLDHMGGRSGRIFRIVRDKTGWTLVPVAVVDSEPDPWSVDGNRLLFLTESGLWSIEPGGATRRIHQTDIGELSASAIVRAPDGAIYVGLRHFVVKLEESNGQWRETWLALSVCAKVEAKGSRCECGPREGLFSQ